MMRQSLLRAPRAIVRSAGGYGKVGGYGVKQAGVTMESRRQAHAISNPTLANIEKRWEAMPPQEQADLWMALRDRMKVNWAELTLQEKKAGMLPYSLLYLNFDVTCCDFLLKPGLRAVKILWWCAQQPKSRPARAAMKRRRVMHSSTKEHKLTDFSLQLTTSPLVPMAHVREHHLERE